MSAVAVTPTGDFYHRPSIARRLVVGVLLVVPLLVAYLALTAFGVQLLESHGLASPYSFTVLATFGLVLSIAAALRYVTKPTALFGWISAAGSVVTLAYLWYLAGASTLLVSVGNGGSLAVSYGELFELLMVVPALGVVAGVVLGVEDRLHPKERLPFDFPAKQPPR